MKGLAPLILGILGTFAFSWLGLTVIPNAQIGHLDPQTDEEGADAYPMPKSGLAERGREIYVSNGCVYCHSQQVRADYAGADIERQWGERRSAPRDYLFERPVLLGKSRLGPDLANVGQRAPAEDAEAAAPAAPDAAAAAASPAPAPAAGVPAPTAPATGNVAAPSPAPGAPTPAAPAAANLAATAPAPGAPAISPAPAPAAASPAASAPVVANAAPASANAPAALPGPPLTGATPAPVDAAPFVQAPLAKDGEPLPYSTTWHHRLLYDPRSIAKYSNMPSYRFLYEKRRIGGQPSANALKLEGEDAPPEGWEVVPTYDAKCLVAYLMSLNQSHALNEVKNTTTAAAPAAAAAAPEGAAK